MISSDESSDADMDVDSDISGSDDEGSELEDGDSGMEYGSGSELGSDDGSEVSGEEGVEIEEGDDSQEEDIVIGSDDEEEDVDSDADDEEKERKQTEKNSIKELRDITRKASKKQIDLVNQMQEMTTFDQLRLSRPLLKALSEMGFTKPTPVQMNTIPPALKGRDICASAITGSGKTAAFILPILERLLYRNASARCTRVLILMPTRELAVQCHSVITNLAKYTNGITAALITGGMNAKKQEMDLRAIPDIIVATPGRVLDHVLNTRSFDLGDVEILVLDEADRLLELGFMEQLTQVVKSCPPSRQTLLFSATMTAKVDDLATLSLKNPARLSVDPMFQVARKLTQEFVRVRSGTERDKESLLLSLCTRTFKSKVIIFCTHKKTAHRLKIIFSLAELNAVELHGDLTQEQRFDSLETFRDGKADFMIASDVASRGLDVIGVDTVINYELPMHLSSYVHRVGRTARAGRSGRAVSLVTEEDRRLFKMIVKNSHDSVKQRVVPPKSLLGWREKLEGWTETVKQVLGEEAEDRLLRMAEMEANKASNLIMHHDEIMARPKKSWFQNADQKKAVDEESKRVHLGKSKFSIDGEDEEFGEDGKKKRRRGDKKRGRDEQMAPPTTTGSKKIPNLYMESKSQKKRKVSRDDEKELKAQRAVLRQRKREKLGRDGAAPSGSSGPRIGGTNKTAGVKLRNKAASSKKKDSNGPGGRKENRDKGKGLFGTEARTAGFGKKGSFKSKSKHKRR